MKVSTQNNKRTHKIHIPNWIVGVCFLFLFWWLLSIIIGEELIIPSPVSVAGNIVEETTQGNLLPALLMTFLKSIQGLTIALAIGTPIGILMGISRKVEEWLRPLTMVIRSMPIVSWLSSVIVIWGIGWQAPVFIVVTTLLPLIIFNIAQGVKSIDVKLIEMARVYQVPKVKIFRQVYLGSIVPFLLSAVRVSLGTMWKVAIVAEYMAGDSGLGINISWAKFYLDTPRVFAFTAVAVISGLLLEYIFDKIIALLSKKGVGIWNQ
jgi:NitT/TauT family transport system permease protein